MNKIMKTFVGGLVVAAVFQVGMNAEAKEQSKTQQLIVKYKEDDALSAKEKKDLNVQSKEQVDDAELIEVSSGETEEVIEQLEANEKIDYVIANTQYEIADDVNAVEDPYEGQQWHIPLIQASNVWMELSAVTNQVKVAVVDTGVYSEHEDLKNRILSGATFLNADQDGIIGKSADDQGHGTALAGIIAANAKNGIGVTGVTGNANVKILPVKVMDSKGEGDAFYIAKGIDYAVVQGVDIINLSISGDYNMYIEEAINRAFAKNIVVVAAAGNGGNDADLFFPGALDHVLSIGSVTQDKQVYYNSNTGASVDFVAPGVNILSTALKTTSLGYYEKKTGTSYATPQVAAIAALYKLKYPQATVNDVETALKNSATDLGNVGRDDDYGNGLVNAESTLAFKPEVRIKPSITSVSINNNSTTATIKTTAFANVTLTLDGNTYTATANDEGVATIKISKPTVNKAWTVLVENEFQLSVKETGKVSDKIAPTISSVTAANNTTKVVVKTEKSAKVKLTIAKKTYTKTASTAGSVVFTISKPTAGTAWTVTATDAANNTTTKKGKVSDKIAPTISSVTAANNTTKVVVKTEKSAKVKLTIAKKTYTKTANAAGSVVFTISKPTAGIALKVTATDAANNMTTKTGKVSDKIAPNKVQLTTKVTTTSQKIIGKTEKNATVLIYRNGIKYKTIKANAKGSFSVTIAKQRKNTALTVYAKDQAGNISKALKITVK